MPEGVYQVKACYTVLSTAFLTVLFGHFDQYIAERDKLFEINFTSSNITSRAHKGFKCTQDKKPEH